MEVSSSGMGDSSESLSGVSPGKIAFLCSALCGGNMESTMEHRFGCKSDVEWGAGEEN